MSETIKLLNLIRSIISVIDKSMTIRKVSFTMLKGLSTDTKPLFGQDVGDMFLEQDTGNLFIYNSGTWNSLTLVIDADAETFSSKTIPVDDNIIKHSTTNTAGDVLTYQTDRYNRLARGTSGQILGVNAGATDTAFVSLTSGHLPSTVVYSDQLNIFLSGQTFNDYLDLSLTSTTTPTSGFVRFFASEIDSDNNAAYGRVLISGSITTVRVF